MKTQRCQQPSLGAWRSLRPACSWIFAICGVSEMTPTFIPVVLEGLETEAREARKGLWADPQPMPPLGWRKRSR